MVRSHARRSGISSVDDLESESVSTGDVTSDVTNRSRNLREFADLDAALSDAPDGGEVLVPVLETKGGWTPASTTKGSFKIQGQGAGRSDNDRRGSMFFQTDSSSPMLLVDHSDSNDDGLWRVYDIGFYAGASGVTCLELNQVSMGSVKSVSFQMAGQDAVAIESIDSFSYNVIGCEIIQATDNQKVIYISGSGGQISIWGNNISGPVYYGQGGHIDTLSNQYSDISTTAVEVDGANGGAMYNERFENVSNALHIGPTSDVDNLTVAEPHFEQISDRAVIFDNAKDCTVTNPQLIRGSASDFIEFTSNSVRCTIRGSRATVGATTVTAASGAVSPRVVVEGDVGDAGLSAVPTGSNFTTIVESNPDRNNTTVINPEGGTQWYEQSTTSFTP